MKRLILLLITLATFTNVSYASFPVMKKTKPKVEVSQPNPVMDVLHIDLDTELFQIELQIVNTMGAQIMTQTIDQNTVGSAIQIQVSDLPKGMYMLRVNSSNSSRSIPWIKM